MRQTKPILITGIALVALAALMAIVFALGRGPSESVLATTNASPTPTFLPTATAKPDDTGNLSGLYDAVVLANASQFSGVFNAYHCILRLDHEDTAEPIEPMKASAQCYANIDIGDPNDANTDIQGEGSLGDASEDASTKSYSCQDRYDNDGDGKIDEDDPHCTGLINKGPGAGPPPPPPYTENAPTKLHGWYNTVTGISHIRGCFDNIGGTLGPNIIVEVIIPNAKGQLNGGGTKDPVGEQTGTLLLLGNTSKEDCATLTLPVYKPSRNPVSSIPLTLYRVGPSATGPVSAAPPIHGTNDGVNPAVMNYDLMVSGKGDLCTDMQELWVEKPSGEKCGDDPFNPYDADQTVPDVSGSWEMYITAIPANWDPKAYDPNKTEDPQLTSSSFDRTCGDGIDNNPSKDPATGGPYKDATDGDCLGKLTGGLYIHCLTDIQQGDPGPKDFDISVFCYTDGEALGTGITVNANEAGAANCPPAARGYCGDGSTGAAPPANPPLAALPAESGDDCNNRADDDGDTVVNDGCPQTYAHVDHKHIKLTGAINNTENTLTMSGCTLGTGGMGNVYWSATTNVHTGQGTANLWAGIASDAECLAGDTSNSTLPLKNAPLSMVKQGNKGELFYYGWLSEDGAGPGTCADGIDNGSDGADSADPDCKNERDTDGDGCSDKKEFGNPANPDDATSRETAAKAGGLRDPYNHWDYFNPSNSRYPDLTTDILPVAFKYHLREQFQTEVDGQTAAGQNQIDVTVAVGHNMQAGDTITINPGGGSEETATIAAGGVDLSSFPTATLTLTANLANKHSDGEQVVRPRDENVPNPPLPDQSYDPEFDRNGALSGANAWNLRPGAGYIDLTTAILKVAMQYHHDCR